MAQRSARSKKADQGEMSFPEFTKQYQGKEGLFGNEVKVVIKMAEKSLLAAFKDFWSPQSVSRLKKSAAKLKVTPLGLVAKWARKLSA